MTDIRLEVIPDDFDLKQRYAGVIGALDLLALTVADETDRPAGYWEISVHLPDATLTASPRSRFTDRRSTERKASA